MSIKRMIFACLALFAGTVTFFVYSWPWFTNNHEILRNIALSIVAILGSPFVVWRTYLFQKDIALKAENTNIADRNSINDIFTKAIEQLGAFKGENEPNINVRMGAIYSLEKLSQNNIDYYPAIIDILCGYVRENSPNERNNNSVARLDIRVAMTIINRRKYPDYDNSLNLSLANLRAVNMVGQNHSYTLFAYSDLRNCNFKETVISFANLEYADIRGAENLTCEQLESAMSWQLAYRDPELACGVSIPTPPDEEEK